MRSKNPFPLLTLTLLAAAGLSLSACRGGLTVTPRQVVDKAPSYDRAGNRTGGFLGYTTNGAGVYGVIDEDARQRYNALIERYKSRHLVPLKADAGLTPFTNGTWLIDKTHNVKAQEMHKWWALDAGK